MNPFNFFFTNKTKSEFNIFRYKNLIHFTRYPVFQFLNFIINSSHFLYRLIHQIFKTFLKK